MIMSQQNGLFDWRVIGKAIAGSAHIRQGLPRQDEICWWPETGVGLPLVLAVSDGHGSEAHFRSSTGAKFAVDAAIDILAKFSEVSKDEKDTKVVMQNAQRNLTREIHRKWLDLVADDVYQNPISHEELARLEMSKGISRMRQVVLQPTLAYGATLLCALVARNYILYLQLGDGDILKVEDDAARVERAIPKDKELAGDETTSLCLPNAWREFRVALTPLSQNPPSLIIICTDGYSNSFTDDDAFLKIAPDYFKWIKDKGLDVVNDNLGKWLSAASAGGSGDDITVGIICRTETPRKPAETSLTESKEIIPSEPKIELDENSSEVAPDNRQEGGIAQTGEVSTRNE